MNGRNFELFLACNTFTPNFYTRCVQLSSYTQIASDVMGAGFAAPALHFGPDFTERNCSMAESPVAVFYFTALQAESNLCVRYLCENHTFMVVTKEMHPHAWTQPCKKCAFVFRSLP